MQPDQETSPLIGPPSPRAGAAARQVHRAAAARVAYRGAGRTEHMGSPWVGVRDSYSSILKQTRKPVKLRCSEAESPPRRAVRQSLDRRNQLPPRTAVYLS